MLAVRNDGIWLAMSKRTIFETCYMKNISFLKTQCQARILFSKAFFAVHSSNANVPSCYSGGCCSSSGDRSSRGSSSIAATATSTNTAATSLVRLAGVHVACAARSINNDKIAFPHMDRAANVVFDSDFAWIWPGFFSETATERLWQRLVASTLACRRRSCWLRDLGPCVLLLAVASHSRSSGLA